MVLHTQVGNLWKKVIHLYGNVHGRMYDRVDRPNVFVVSVDFKHALEMLAF